MKKQLLTKLKREVKVLMGYSSPIRKELECKYEWYGSDYGGFYIHPNILNGDSVIYSFGIGEDISFDNDVLNKHKCNVFGFDPTPKSIQWIRNQQLPTGFNFLEYGIDSKTGFVNFNLPKNESHVSGSMVSHQNVDEKNTVSVPMKCFDDITTELGHKHIDVLKMDIEGAEFDVIDSILCSSVKINQILIELHERFFSDGKLRTIKLLKSLKDKGYAIFAVSDTFEEVSFIKMESIRLYSLNSG